MNRPGCTSDTCIHLERRYQVPIVLTAGQLNSDIKQIVDSDGWFIWRGISIPSTSALGTVQIRFQVNDYFLSNARVPMSIYSFNANRCKAFEREIPVRPGGQISIDAFNSGGSTYTGSVLLLGVTQLEVKR